MPEVLSFQSVSLYRGNKVILKDTSLDLPLSGIILLSGENGAGKSTILRACLGLTSLQKGNILFAGNNPKDSRKSVGYMPQSLNDDALMIPAINHVASGIDGTKWGFPINFKSKRKKAEHFLHMTNSLGFAKRPLGFLSGGERQRVGLALALTGEPKWLILDEPFSGLDHKSQDEIVLLLLKLVKKLSLSILMTSHETRSLDGIVDHVVELEKGQLHVRI
ncbi:ATP-binding cassette domain-containing protein [Swingsia samuiensis]|nr:ATP-binding cassette domain-containing protein [Swingsia samuiensis]